MEQTLPAYAGDLTSTEAWQLLAREPGGVLVDVRTDAEWTYVGVPDLTGLGKKLVTVTWNHWPDGTRNPYFLDELRAAGCEDASSLVFICRSGQRSMHAAIAATAAGLGPAYNVSDGFEGDLDPSGHRGVQGWRASGLPWRQE